MDMSVINDLQHLRLTKDEEEDIQISSMNRSDLMEECALSLFGKLLTDRQQNQRALKNTLRAAWKMGSDLRIVDMGKNLFQFKFNSGFQLEWVEEWPLELWEQLASSLQMEKGSLGHKHHLHSCPFLGSNLGPAVQKLIWRCWKRFRQQLGALPWNG